MAFIQVRASGKVESFVSYNDPKIKQKYFTVTRDDDNKYHIMFSDKAAVDMLFSDRSDLATSNQCLEPMLTITSERSCMLTFWDPKVREYVATGFAFYAELKNYTGGSGTNYDPDNNTLSQLFTYRV